MNPEQVLCLGISLFDKLVIRTCFFVYLFLKFLCLLVLKVSSKSKSGHSFHSSERESVIFEKYFF